MNGYRAASRGVTVAAGVALVVAVVLGGFGIVAVLTHDDDAGRDGRPAHDDGPPRDPFAGPPAPDDELLSYLDWCDAQSPTTTTTVPVSRPAGSDWFCDQVREGAEHRGLTAP